MRIGILAEDVTDCDVASVLVRRIALEDLAVPNVGVNAHSGRGCARLRTKAASRLGDLARAGCAGAVILHDLDRDPNTQELRDETALRAELEAIANPLGLTRLVCIPIEELEAWFWSDQVVVELVGRGKGQASKSPHLIKKPKEALINLSIGANKRPRYDTNDGKTLASKLALDVCTRACPSFAQFREFVREVVGAAAV
jgi:hypothetical protein